MVRACPCRRWPRSPAGLPVKRPRRSRGRETSGTVTRIPRNRCARLVVPITSSAEPLQLRAEDLALTRRGDGPPRSLVLDEVVPIPLGMRGVELGSRRLTPHQRRLRGKNGQASSPTSRPGGCGLIRRRLENHRACSEPDAPPPLRTAAARRAGRDAESQRQLVARLRLREPMVDHAVASDTEPLLQQRAELEIERDRLERRSPPVSVRSPLREFLDYGAVPRPSSTTGGTAGGRRHAEPSAQPRGMLPPRAARCAPRTCRARPARRVRVEAAAPPRSAERPDAAGDGGGIGEEAQEAVEVDDRLLRRDIRKLPLQEASRRLRAQPPHATRGAPRWSSRRGPGRRGTRSSAG